MANLYMNVYNQAQYDDEIDLVGTREALTALRDTLTRLLASNHCAEELYVVDSTGEVCQMRVILANEPGLSKLRPVLGEHKPGDLHPQMLIQFDNKFRDVNIKTESLEDGA